MTTVARMRSRIAVTARVLRAVLRSPALRRVEAAFLLFNTVEFSAWVAILLYAYAAIGPASVEIVAVIQLIPAAIVAPLSANLGDRFPRGKVLFGGHLVMVVAFGATWHRDGRIASARGRRPRRDLRQRIAVGHPSDPGSAVFRAWRGRPEELTAANAPVRYGRGSGRCSLGPFDRGGDPGRRHAGGGVRGRRPAACLDRGNAGLRTCQPLGVLVGCGRRPSQAHRVD